MIGGGEYSWILTDTGYVWSGPGAPPGCGPGCCGGCKTRPGQRLFGFPVEDNSDKLKQYSVPPSERLTELLKEGKELGDLIRNDFDKINRYVDRPVPNILSNYVTKKELKEALDEVRGICGNSIDKENSGRCTKSKGHKGFCDRL